MKKQDFLNDVEHEVRMLKKHGTKEELARMDLDGFQPEHQEHCIYGQMTGSCVSKRAKILMDKSCVRVFSSDPFRFKDMNYNGFKPYINGTNKGQGWNDDGGNYHWTTHSRNYNHSSALEGYILMKGAKIKMIISFLKGESDKLKL